MANWRKRLFPLAEMSGAARRFWIALALLALLLIFSTAYYLHIESADSQFPWTFVEALYMAVLVITTVGTMEVHPLSPNGRLFTSVFAMISMAVVFALFVPSAISLLIGQQLSAQLQLRRRLRALQQLTDHYIVCGYGRMGQEAVSQLLRRGIRVAVIEQSPEAVEALRLTDIPYVEGNAAQDEHLKLAGVERARGLIAAVGSDEDNVFIVLSARLLNPALYIVARASREENIAKLNRVGANRVMSPYVVGGRALAAAAADPGLADFVEMVLHREDIDLEIALIPVPTESVVVNQPLQGSGILKEQGAMILAIMDRNGQFHTNPYPLSTITEGDRLIAMGTRQQLEEVRRVVGG